MSSYPIDEWTPDIGSARCLPAYMTIQWRMWRKNTKNRKFRILFIIKISEPLSMQSFITIVFLIFIKHFKHIMTVVRRHGNASRTFKIASSQRWHCRNNEVVPSLSAISTLPWHVHVLCEYNADYTEWIVLRKAGSLLVMIRQRMPRDSGTNPPDKAEL